MSITRCMWGDHREVHVERTHMWEDMGKGTAMDPHAGVVWWRGEGGHGKGKGMGGEYKVKVGGMGTAMHVGHVGQPMWCKQVENKKKNWLEKKEGRGEHIPYRCGCGWA